MLHWDPAFGGWGKKPRKRLNASMPLPEMIQCLQDRERDPEDEDPRQVTPPAEEEWYGPILGFDVEEYFWPPGGRPDRTRAN